MGSVAVSNFLLLQTNNTIDLLDGARAELASQTSIAHAFERTILKDLMSEASALFASDPELATSAITINDAPILQILDTRGNEQFRVTLPSRKILQGDYFMYLTGSGYAPSSTVEANAYYENVQTILANRVPNESQDFAVTEALAETVEKQIPILLDQLKITIPTVREWVTELAWQAGDGDDRSRELLGHTVTALLMTTEIDDYSAPGLTMTSDRTSLRFPLNSPMTDAANSMVDEITGNTDTTGMTDCFIPLSPVTVGMNKVALDAVLRYTPALHTAGGVADALAQVKARSEDVDMISDATAELINKGTALDPVLLAIQAAARYNTATYSVPDTTQAL